MKWQISDRSLFAVLMRSPWWMSVGIAVLVTVLALALLPAQLRLGGALMALPFFVIGTVAASRQWRLPRAGQIERVQQVAAGMAWPEFADVLDAAFQREGYTVTRGTREPVDFQLEREGRITFVCARRWKSARTGLEALRTLHDAKESAEAQRARYVCLGELTDTARAFAASHRIEIWQAPQLTAAMPALARKPAPASGGKASA
jgi:restriction system protein